MPTIRHCSDWRWFRAVVSLVLLLASAPLSAQTVSQEGGTPAPGDWTIRDVGPLRLLVEPGPAEAQLERAAEVAEQQLPRLFEDLGFSRAEVARVPRFHVVLADRARWGRDLEGASPGPEPAAVRRLDRRAPPWAAGYQLPRDRLGVVRLDRVDRYPFDGLDSVLVHEVSHQLLFDRIGAGRVPRWFDEALAMHEARRRGARDLVVLASSTLFAPVPPLGGLDWEFQRSEVRARRAYAASFEFLDWALNRSVRTGSAALTQAPLQTLLDSLAASPTTSFADAWQVAFGEPLWFTEQEWREGRWRIDRWAPVLLFNPNLWWSLIALLALVAAVVRRRRTRRQHELWEVEERQRAELQAELERAVAEQQVLKTASQLRSVSDDDLLVN